MTRSRHRASNGAASALEILPNAPNRRHGAQNRPSASNQSRQRSGSAASDSIRAGNVLHAAAAPTAPVAPLTLMIAGGSGPCQKMRRGAGLTVQVEHPLTTTRGIRTETALKMSGNLLKTERPLLVEVGVVDPAFSRELSEACGIKAHARTAAAGEFGLDGFSQRSIEPSSFLMVMTGDVGKHHPERDGHADPVEGIERA